MIYLCECDCIRYSIRLVKLYNIFGIFIVGHNNDIDSVAGSGIRRGYLFTHLVPLYCASCSDIQLNPSHFT